MLGSGAMGRLKRPLERLLASAAALSLVAVPSAVLAETSIERAARTGELSLGVVGDIPPYVSRRPTGTRRATPSMWPA